MASTSKRRFEAENGGSGGVVEFMVRFSDERVCADRLLGARNPGGWVCPKCGNRRRAPMSGRPRPPTSGSTPPTSCRTRSAASPERNSPAPSRPTSDAMAGSECP